MCVGTSIVGENYGYLKKYNIFENQIKKPFVTILILDWINKKPVLYWEKSIVLSLIFL